jgi:O-6-methylguanine DNA methyltransferase
MSMMDFLQKVLHLTGKIPEGRVTTYSEIARALGKPGASRAVGNALRKNECPERIPCYRVVRSDGSVGGYSGVMNSREKIRRLERDGIAISRGKVDLKRHFRSFKKRASDYQ